MQICMWRAQIFIQGIQCVEIYGSRLKSVVPFVINLGFGLVPFDINLGFGFVGADCNYFDPKNGEDITASPDDIYEDSDADRVVIEAGGKEIILSIRAEKRLLKILNEREKSSSLYI